MYCSVVARGTNYAHVDAMLTSLWMILLLSELMHILEVLQWFNCNLKAVA